jgi:hypothetical protein
VKSPGEISADFYRLASVKSFVDRKNISRKAPRPFLLFFDFTRLEGKTEQFHEAIVRERAPVESLPR